MKNWINCSISDRYRGFTRPRYTLLVALLLASVLQPVRAQKARVVSGSAQFRLEDAMSKEQLRAKLRDQAIIQALTDEFGSRVEQESYVRVQDGIPQFRIAGNNLVMGEWLKTTDERYSEELVAVGKGRDKRFEVWLRCDISGLVRPISKQPPKFEVKTYKCPSDTCMSELFRDGESLYLGFRSPVAGTISVYMMEDQRVWRLLPYLQMADPYAHSVPVEANKSYMLFSGRRESDYFPDFPSVLTDELMLTSEGKETVMDLYVVFSTEPYLSPDLSQVTTSLRESGEPRSLDSAVFRDWLSDNRIRSESFYYRMQTLRVAK